MAASGRLFGHQIECRLRDYVRLHRACSHLCRAPVRKTRLFRPIQQTGVTRDIGRSHQRHICGALYDRGVRLLKFGREVRKGPKSHGFTPSDNRLNRHDYRAASSLVDAQLYKEVYSYWLGQAQTVYNSTGARQTFAIQLVPSSVAAYGNNHGGNPIGIPEVTHQCK